MGTRKLSKCIIIRNDDDVSRKNTGFYLRLNRHSTVYISKGTAGF